MVPVLEGSGSAAAAHGKVRASTVFQSYSLHVSIVGFFLLFAKNGFVVGVRSLKVTARHLNNAGLCYEYTIVSVPRFARRYTIHCSLPNTHTVHIELDGGRQGGREGCREGARKDGGWEGGSKGRVGERLGSRDNEGVREGGREGGREGERERGRVGARVGREEAMMIVRERESVSGGREGRGREGC